MTTITASTVAASATDLAIIPTTFEMPPQEITVDVLKEKYCKGVETTVDEIHVRVARSLASCEVESRRVATEAEFLWALRSGFVPAGRISSAAGTDINATLINCFVQPVADAMVGHVNGRPGIYTALTEAAETMRRGGGVGYNFSHIRPKGALVKGTNSDASGPISYMHVYDTSCGTIVSAGSRRGAQMGVLRCDHPDIFDFITAKRGGRLTDLMIERGFITDSDAEAQIRMEEGGPLRNFNLSIGVTDEFMRAVMNKGTFELVHDAEPCNGLAATQRADGKWIYATVNALDLWDSVMRSTYDFAEPGILFLDRINAENNLFYCEIIESMNPCGEQPLPDYGCCCLGSINLTRFVRGAFTADASFDFEAFAAVVKVSVRMLDNVLDVTMWPLEQQRKEAMNKRRVGLGFLGLGDALIMLGLRYDTEEARQMASSITETMRDCSYTTSVALAQEKGAFPLFNAAKYLKSGFAMRLPAELRKSIRKFGLRNSHLLSIAPTGTIVLAFADNASNGIEPAFSWTYDRKKNLVGGGKRTYEVADHAYRVYREKGGDVNNLPNSFVTALEMSAANHMAMMVAVQPYIDSAISKTVNVAADYPFEDFQSLYMDAWKAGLKGLATYRPNLGLASVLSVKAAPVAAPAVAKAPVAVAEIDPMRVSLDNRPEGDLEGVTRKIVYWTTEGKQSVYLTVNFARVSGILNGEKVEIERPVEFFIPSSQMGNGQQWVASHMVQMSLNARSGGSVSKSLSNMRSVIWEKGAVRCGFFFKEDGTKVPRFHDSDVAAIGYAVQDILFNRGFLDIDGNQVPVRILSKNLAVRNTFGDDEDAVEVQAVSTVNTPVSKPASVGKGRKCPECGAHAVHKRDGCDKCDNCGMVGSCG